MKRRFGFEVSALLALSLLTFSAARADDSNAYPCQMCDIATKIRASKCPDCEIEKQARILRHDELEKQIKDEQTTIESDTSDISRLQDNKLKDQAELQRLSTARKSNETDWQKLLANSDLNSIPEGLLVDKTEIEDMRLKLKHDQSELKVINQGGETETLATYRKEMKSTSFLDLANVVNPEDSNQLRANPREVTSERRTTASSIVAQSPASASDAVAAQGASSGAAVDPQK
jgi:hypothetical protein